MDALYIVAYIAWVFAIAMVARSKNRSMFLWGLFAMFSIFALIIVFFPEVKDEGDKNEHDRTKTIH